MNQTVDILSGIKGGLSGVFIGDALGVPAEFISRSKLKNNPVRCSDYVHVHVIPSANTELRKKITAPGCSGNDISEVWRNMLKNPDKYLVVTPEGILKPCEILLDCKAILSYLKCRYW